MFKLSKYLFIIGIPITIICIILLSWMYRVVTFEEFQNKSQDSNIILARSMANVVWPQISGIVKVIKENYSTHHDSKTINKNSLNIINIMLEESISKLIVKTNVLKVKIYTPDGLTVFSTISSEIGYTVPAKLSSIRKANRGEISTVIELKENFVNHMGEELHDRYVLSSYLPIYDQFNNTVDGIFVIYTDVSSVFNSVNLIQLKFSIVLATIFIVILIVVYFILRHLEKALKRNIELAVTRDSAKDANIAKSNFLANMSHELRTPLNAIIGYSEILEEDVELSKNAQSLHDIDKIQTSAKHLLHLINEILDLSKIEAGQLNLYMEDLELNVFIDEIIAVTAPLLNKNNNRLTLHFSNEIDFIHSDLIKLRQILFNLISNSSKFTENGTISLNVAEKDGYLVISVTDTGIGMTQEQINKLFKPFVQADDSTTRKYGGTGLGLTITKQFVQMLGGTISVVSKPNQGASFTVKLPLKTDQLENLQSEKQVLFG